MRAREFIIEATPQSLQPPVLDKLFKTYQTRDINDHHIPKFENGLGVANFIFNTIGPKSLIWVVKQYNIDQHFFLHDLSQWKSSIAEFDRLRADKRIQLPKNDLNQYQGIDELRKVISQFSANQQSLGSKFYSNAISLIDEFVKAGDADWLYRSNDYSIYHPKTFESSNVCASTKFDMSTKICTIMSQFYFDEYSKNGTLMYIIDHSKLYNCYISKDGEKKESEFADELNNHTYDLDWMLENFPVLSEFIKSVSGPRTELWIKLKFVSDKKEAYQICLESVSNYGTKLRDIPDEFKTLEICAIATTNDTDETKDIPEHILRDPEFISKVVELDPEIQKFLIYFASDDMINKIINMLNEEAYDSMIYDIVMEWEHNDDYFYQWQQEEARKKGYLLMPDNSPYENTTEQNNQLEDDGLDLEDLEVDDERIFEDDELNDYLNYSYEAKQFVRDARDACSPSPEVVRDIALEMLFDYGKNYDISAMELIISRNVENEMGREENGGLSKMVLYADPIIDNKTGDIIGVRRTKREIFQSIF